MLKSLIPARPFGRLLLAAAVAVGMLAASPEANALIASDNSSNYTGTFVGQNGGTGFNAWTSDPIGSGGSYIGATGLSADSFGIFAGGGAGNSMSVYRGFTSAMSIGDVFSIDLGYTGVDTGGQVGINFLAAGNTRLTFKFTGGTSFWTLNDGGSDFDTNIPWGGGNPGTTLNVQFTRGTGNFYSVLFTQGADVYTGTNYESTSGVMDINEIGIFSTAQGGSQNVGFNNLSVVPEPSTYALLGLGTAFGLWQLRRRRKE